MMYALCVMIAAAQLQANYDPGFVALFKPLEYRYSGGEYRDDVFQYRLFTPELNGPNDKKPLLVWLHGLGEAGRDNLHQLRWLSQLIFRPAQERQRYPFFLLAVQCPKENPAWTVGDSAAGDDMVNVVAAIVERTLRDYPVDRARVVLAGISSGGAGSWELAMRRPELFAAVAPISSGGADQARLALLGDIPIWVFNCSFDSSTPIDGVRATVESLKAAGGSVHLTEVDSTTHDAWTAAFEEYHLLDWLLAQRRGYASPPPGSVALRTRLADFAESWQWWQVLAQIGIPLLLVAAAWQAVRARRRAMARSSGRP